MSLERETVGTTPEGECSILYDHAQHSSAGSGRVCPAGVQPSHSSAIAGGLNLAVPMNLLYLNSLLVPRVCALDVFGASPNVDLLHCTARDHALSEAGVPTTELQRKLLVHILSGQCVEEVRQSGVGGCLQVARQSISCTEQWHGVARAFWNSATSEAVQWLRNAC